MPRNPNRRMGQAIAEELERSGVVSACVSPGSRSSALALALAAAPGIRVFVVTDERSSGFFALGLAREQRRPVVLLCTSGTAAANYLPAVVEASLAHVPLIVLTADRPPELRDCGAPQTIAQASLFAGYVRWSFDVPVPTEGVDLDRLYRTLACRAVAATLEWPGGPVHLNLPMREPLVEVGEEASIAGAEQPAEARPFTTVHAARAVTAPQTLERLARTLEGRERGLIVGGPGIDAAAADEIARLARILRWPILADPLSGLRFGSHDRSALADGYDVLLRDREFAKAHAPHAILQIGSLPASKSLAVFLEEIPRGCHVVVAPPGRWPDPLHRATDVVRAAPQELCAALAARLPVRPAPSPWLDDWLENSAALRAALDDEIAAVDEVLEGKLFPLLCERLPPDSLVVLGNSMPVRDADTFLGSSDRVVRFCGNRGASGIDGVMSSALGAAAARRDHPTVLVVGDLSFLHDLGALQIAARHAVPLLIIAVHNDGGGIFSFLPQASLDEAFDALFATPHGLALEPAVRMCGGRHVRVASWAGFTGAIDAALGQGGLRVVELASDRGRNRTLRERTIAAALERLRRHREKAA